jgi:hypothetical protein
LADRSDDGPGAHTKNSLNLVLPRLGCFLWNKLTTEKMRVQFAWIVVLVFLVITTTNGDIELPHTRSTSETISSTRRISSLHTTRGTTGIYPKIVHRQTQQGPSTISQKKNHRIVHPTLRLFRLFSHCLAHWVFSPSLSYYLDGTLYVTKRNTETLP